MPNRRIFVSCGQLTSKEKSLSEELINVIDKNGMKGFSAEETHQPADLNSFLFKEIQRCDGLVAVMQKRGEIRYLTYPLTQRSSVWIQQEIAILFYRSFLVGKPIPVRVYIEKGVLREGLMNFSIINPIEFTAKKTILEDLPRWLLRTGI